MLCPTVHAGCLWKVALRSNPDMEIIELAETRSTNTYLSTIATESCHGTVVIAHAQTAGRGQRGNHWESAPGENITMSLLLRPNSIRPAEQFVISQAISVAIVNVLRRYIHGRKVAVKWPNDIYVDDMKICGILIENTLSGSSIDYSIIGMGMNVNQSEFLSDAPNPVSMLQLTGKHYPLRQLTEEFVNEILSEFGKIDVADNDTARKMLAEEYVSMLWRHDGFYPYHDNLRDRDILAAIKSVASTGHITLVTTDDEEFTYAFKEIAAIIQSATLK